MLLEDTVAVGDVVDLGGGYSGSIEAISIRTIKLRDVGGTLQTVPFSEVSKVKNMTKDYSYFVVDTGVGYDADIDKAQEVQCRVAEEMKADPAFGSLMLGTFEVLGVDALGASTVTLKGRIKTLPGKQWTIGREFNRRIKVAFPAAGIPFPGTVAAPSLAQEFANILAAIRESDRPDTGKPAAPEPPCSDSAAVELASSDSAPSDSAPSDSASSAPEEIEPAKAVRKRAGKPA
jgi:small-conductance mechanosensitive channel